MADAASRPRRLWAVVGTGTEVGKTYVGSRLLSVWRDAGQVVAARKPVQSFDAADADGDTDAGVLAAATGEPIDTVCSRHRWYRVPMAPPMAVDLLGRQPFTVADLVSEITWPAGVDVGLVETVGGVRSPIAEDGDSADLVAAVQPDNVLLVADAGLGTINGVRLTVEVLRARVPGAALTVHLNRYDPADDLHRRNREWLERRDGLVVATDL